VAEISNRFNLTLYERKKSTYEKRGGNIYRRDLLVLIFNFIFKVLFNIVYLKP